MFDFWREVIINDAGTLARELKVYKKDYVIGKVADKDGDIYKTTPDEGTPAVITVPTISEATRVRIELGLSVGQSSEFAAPYFASKKTVVVDATNDAGIVKALGVALEGLAVVNKTAKTITFSDKKVCVNSVHIATIDSETKDWGADSPVTATWVTTANVVPVGTGAWIIENLRFPTSVNTGYTSPNAAEDVDAKAKYVQYAFEYAAPKRGFHGQGAVGQEVTSVTHHVFYVKDEITDADTAFEALGTVIATNPTNDKVYSYHDDQVGTTNANGAWTGTAVTREQE